MAVSRRSQTKQTSNSLGIAKCYHLTAIHPRACRSLWIIGPANAEFIKTISPEHWE